MSEIKNPRKTQHKSFSKKRERTYAPKKKPTKEPNPTSKELNSIRIKRAYYLKNLANPNLREKVKEKSRKKLELIYNKIAELTNTSVDEVKKDYNARSKRWPRKHAKVIIIDRGRN